MVTTESSPELDLYQIEKQNILNAKNKLPDIVVSNRYKDLKVLGLVADTSACGYYRVINPLHSLKIHGAEVNYSSFHSFDSFMSHDIIVAPRQHSPEVYEALRQAAWEGKFIIYELDDDLHSVLPSSPAYQVYHPGSPELAMLPKIMYACHGVTTTTPEIARWYYKDNRNVAILGNYIDPGFRDWGMDVKYDLAGNPTVTLKDIQKPEEWKDKIVIMYSGGSTHGEDMQQIGHPLKKILEKYPNVQLALNLGINHVQDLIQKFNLPYDQVTYVPARHFLDHPTALHGADIGLAPLIPCQFNCAKSELKFLEMSAVGAVPVGSNVGPYARFNRKHPGYSLLVGNQGSDSFNTWEEALESLINNPEKLATMKAQARQLILDEYLLEKNIDRWPAAWMQIADNVRKGIVGRPDKIESIGHYKSYGRLGPNDPCPCGSGKKKKKCCGGAW